MTVSHACVGGFMQSWSGCVVSLTENKGYQRWNLPLENAESVSREKWHANENIIEEKEIIYKKWKPQPLRFCRHISVSRLLHEFQAGVYLISPECFYTTMIIMFTQGACHQGWMGKAQDIHLGNQAWFPYRWFIIFRLVVDLLLFSGKNGSGYNTSCQKVNHVIEKISFFQPFPQVAAW